MSKYTYVVTAHKPTIVTHSITGNFTGPNDLNLILAKCTRLEIHLMTPEGLEPMYDIPIYGRISSLRLYRPPGAKQDRLFVCTARYNFFVIECEAKSKKMTTQASGDLRHKIGRKTDTGQIGIIDPSCKCIGIHLYDGIFQVIPMDSRGDLNQEAYDMRLEEQQVIAMCFLDGMETPTMMLLLEDSKEKRWVKTYNVNLQTRDLEMGPWQQCEVEKNAWLLIPVPAPTGGVLIVGEECILYMKGKHVISKPVNPTKFSACGKVDHNRFLIGDLMGNLYVLVLRTNNMRVLSIHVELLGETSVAQSISYLDNGYVFIGSAYGDSQLIKLNAEKDHNNSFIDIQEEYDNLASIIHFTVVDLDRQGQGQIVTCSGGLKSGSLRIIQNGVAIHEESSVEMPGIKGIWSLRDNYETPFHRHLVESFDGETRILGINGELMEEIDIPGFQADAQTIFCGNVLGNFLLQITPFSCRLISCTSHQLTAKWNPRDPGIKITVAYANAQQVLLAMGKKLVLIAIKGNKLVQENVKQLEHEVACIHIVDNGESKFAALGMWTEQSARIIVLPSFKEICREKFSGEVIPRSLRLINFGKLSYLFCGLGDGRLYYFIMSGRGKLSNGKSLVLGSHPIILRCFQNGNSTHLLACCDRPTVIYSNGKKVLFSNVNLKDVNYMTPFNSEFFPDCLALTTPETLLIGGIDKIQKLQVDTIPMKDQPRRIAHQQSSKSFAVLTSTVGECKEIFSVKLLDDQTFEILNSVQLHQHEKGSSLISLTFAEDNHNYYAVGTAYVIPDESEPTRGRIIIYRVIEQTLQEVTSTQTKGGVYTMDSFRGMLVAGINSKVQLYKWKIDDESKQKLIGLCAHHGNIIALKIKAMNNHIIVGDLMKSISLLSYRQQTNTLQELSRDYDAKWMTALEMITDEIYLGAENSFNLFTVTKDSESTSEEERTRLKVIGRYHLGEFVNHFEAGSLVMDLPDGDNKDRVIPTHLFATINGVIGVVASLTKHQFMFFSKLESELQKVINGVGGLKHEDWREFSNERKTLPRLNFIDGDLIESFLELSEEQWQCVAKAMELSIESILKRVEDISRIH